MNLSHFGICLVVPPSHPNLTLPSFQENTASSVQCRVSTVKPGVGSVVFAVAIDSDFCVQSSDSDLSEGSADVITGTVSVTYSPQISLQRKHNGQQAVCTVVWREQTVTSESENVNVSCKYCFPYVISLIHCRVKGMVSRSSRRYGMNLKCITLLYII